MKRTEKQNRPDTKAKPSQRHVKDTTTATSYVDGKGRRVTEVTCECKGKGCDTCKGLGFIRQGELGV